MALSETPDQDLGPHEYLNPIIESSVFRPCVVGMWKEVSSSFTWDCADQGQPFGPINVCDPVKRQTAIKYSPSKKESK
jgi:hypothetical protein